MRGVTNFNGWNWWSEIVSQNVFFSRKMGAPIIRMPTSASGGVSRSVCMKYLQTWLLLYFAWVVCCDISCCCWFPFVIIFFIKEVCSRAPTLPQLQTLDKWVLRGVIQNVNLLHRTWRDQGPKPTLRWCGKNSINQSYCLVLRWTTLASDFFSPLKKHMRIFSPSHFYKKLLTSPEYKQASWTSVKWWKDGRQKEVLQSLSFDVFWTEDKTSSTLSYSFLCFHPAAWSCWKLPVNEPNWSYFFLIFSERKGSYCSFLSHLTVLWICWHAGMLWKPQNYTPIVKWKDSQYSVQKLAVSAIWSS